MFKYFEGTLFKFNGDDTVYTIDSLGGVNVGFRVVGDTARSGMIRKAIFDSLIATGSIEQYTPPMPPKQLTISVRDVEKDAEITIAVTFGLECDNAVDLARKMGILTLLYTQYAADGSHVLSITDTIDGESILLENINSDNYDAEFPTCDHFDDGCFNFS